MAKKSKPLKPAIKIGVALAALAAILYVAGRHAWIERRSNAGEWTAGDQSDSAVDPRVSASVELDSARRVVWLAPKPAADGLDSPGRESKVVLPHLL